MLDDATPPPLPGPSALRTGAGPLPLVVGGRAVLDGSVVEVASPASPTGGRDVVHADAAVVAEAASTADGARAACAAMSRRERAQILRRTAAYLESHIEDLAVSLVLEVGKSLRDSRGEVQRCVATLEAAADAVAELGGREVPVDAVPVGAGRLAFTTWEPVGVVAAIAGFNFPLLLAVHKVAGAIGAGCPVLLKPSERTPFTTLVLAEAVVTSGWPPAAISILNGGPDVATALCEDPHVRLVSFTGSSAIGAKIAERAGRHLKRVVLELGSNAATIVAHDADLSLAARSCATGGTASTGQSCISVQRVIAHRSIADDLARRIGEEVAALTTGDPLDPDTVIGNLISPAEVRRVAGLVDDAVAHGAEVVTGGVDGGKLRPTVLLGVTAPARLCREEVFGPVIAVLPYDDLDEAVDLANSTPYGLMAGVFTASIDTALRLARGVESGGVHINDTSNFRADNMPYGGVKSSGIGKEGPASAIREMSVEKVITFRLPA
ncbi:aldehyde dehydrogenase family protein [Saccharopolyspora oryzae]|uniref:Aldehyde dehydrogenase family protein n=1 Tax=Saccharopolyspora oryzae TaxID=2997343 RepID=A0ABT4VBX3_9PSEU|nr:aldehyde dehydrogenase family protein [Saccharopolyspora oryzae]MDA3630782.1 aldehyde dehydrogenase family protein [Saccharopolyspora oryzae]